MLLLGVLILMGVNLAVQKALARRDRAQADEPARELAPA
jgi:hypothetical protein